MADETPFLVDRILEIAVKTQVFSAQEIEILREVAGDYVKRPDENYSLITVHDQSDLAGFIIFGRTPLTENTWDLYWLALDPVCHGRGLGMQLMNDLFARTGTQQGRRAVIRIETSSRPEYARARQLYLRSGFLQAGRIDHFYQSNDHLMIYSKQLSSGEA